MSVNPDSIPRYAQPMDPPTPARRHENCGHACELGGTLVCCCERDKVGRLGDLYVIEDPAGEGCRDWEEA